jgi:hypothetical protein
MTENIFVIFAPLHGGNHLANIISTADRLPQRFDESIYNDSTKFYAHPNSSQNYNPSESQLELLQNQSGVYCAHLAEYLLTKSLTEKYLVNRKYVIIEFSCNNLNSTVQKRLLTKTYHQDQYLMSELSMLYSLDTFSRLTNETDLARVDINLLFDPDISKLLNVLHLEFGFNFDYDFVTSIHQKWMDKNKLKDL